MMSASLSSNDTVCVCLEKKRKRYWLWTQVRYLCLWCHYCWWIGTDRGKKVIWTLTSAADKGLSFLQRHNLSECLGKIYESRETEGTPLPSSLLSTPVPEMKWFCVCSAYAPSSPVHAWAQILSFSGTALPKPMELPCSGAGSWGCSHQCCS